ncbi:MAG: single-stranded-DNA-specific exonuclease RecJ [Planctomycetota bacterium]|nr:MAG: single-stranded-DNA-specific exonuclease RecJ [Planctomycetota bacterium]
MPKHWIIASPWPGRADAARRLGISPLVSQLLYNRGITEPDHARSFLNPELKSLHDPELLTGTKKAARIIADKIRQRKKIIIYGDYDVDGITGTAILWHLLTLAGADISFYIPHRLEEGYGLNADALKQLHSEGADTVITVDCGITATAEAQIAREIGLTLIVTDHHECGPELPDADAVIHPRIDDYPNPNLCGAGVAFKLAWAIAKNLSRADRVKPQFRQFLIDAVGLVALGTIADIVPLTEENRILTRFGLMGLAQSNLVGLNALIETARLTDTKINSEHVGYWLAPRLNAAGRMGHAQLAVELLTRADHDRGKEISIYLEEQNRRRKTLENRIFKQACEIIDSQNLASDSRRAIVLAAPDWHAGVIGIVASRIVDRYHRPTVMIAIDNGEGQGSARSVRHFELHKALADCSQHLIAFGGHAMAAGLRIKQENIESFTETFVQRANQLLTGKDLQPALRLDAEVKLHELTEPVVRTIEHLGPFGSGNPKPRFASGELHLNGSPRLVGKSGDHLQFNLTDGKIRKKAIAFGQKEHLQPLLDHRRCRVAFAPILNTFNGQTTVEMQVLDFEFPQS